MFPQQVQQPGLRGMTAGNSFTNIMGGLGSFLSRPFGAAGQNVMQGAQQGGVNNTALTNLPQPVPNNNLASQYGNTGAVRGSPLTAPSTTQPITKPIAKSNIAALGLSNTAPITNVANYSQQQNATGTPPSTLTPPTAPTNAPQQGQPQSNQQMMTPSGVPITGDPGTFAGAPQNQSQQTKSGDLFGGLFNTPQNQQYLQQQADLYGRIAALQEQMAKANVPSGLEIGQQNLANQLQQNLSNLNPQQYLRDHPNLQQGGITESQLQNQVSQEQMPLEQQLSQAILSRSALANVRTNTVAALGAQGTGLGAQSTALQQIRQLQQFGGLPPEMANAIFQKQFYPQQQVTTDVYGQPQVVTLNPQGGVQGTTPVGPSLFGGSPGSPASPGSSNIMSSLAQQVVDGKMSYEQASGSFGTPGQKLAFNQAIQAINPNFSPTLSQANYTATQNALQNAVPLIQAQRTAIDHLNALSNDQGTGIVDKVGYAGGFGAPLRNFLTNSYNKYVSPNSNIQQLNSAIGIVRGEVAKVLGGGTATVEALQEAQQVIPDNLSPKNFSDVKKKVIDLMQSKIDEYTKTSNVAQFGQSNNGIGNQSAPNNDYQTYLKAIGAQ